MVMIGEFKKSTLAAIESDTIQLEHRPYLGCSKLGHSCDTFLWYAFRWCFPMSTSPRMKRLWDRGHREEPAIIKQLESVGVRCYGDQEEIVLAHGHCKGHIDGKAIGVIEAPKTEHLLEFKTMNNKYFKQTQKDGVKKSKPVYYGQMQIYMYKMGLTRALFCVVNKDNDHYYFERVQLDKGFASDLERKAERIILSEVPPKKQFKSTWYECRYCDARPICHGNDTIEINCRTCGYLDLHPEGQWKCSLYNDLLMSTSQQRLACQYYEKIDLIDV